MGDDVEITYFYAPQLAKVENKEAAILELVDQESKHCYVTPIDTDAASGKRSR